MNNNEIRIIGKVVEKLKTGTDGENRRIRLEIRPCGHWLFAQVYEPELVDIADRLEVGDTIEGTGRVDIFDGRKKKGQPKTMIEVVFETLKKADDFAPVAGWKLVGEIAGDRMETFVRHRDGMDLTSEKASGLSTFFELPEVGATDYTFTMSDMLFGLLGNFAGKHDFKLTVIDAEGNQQSATLTINI